MATDYPKFLYDNRLNDATAVASTTASGNVLNLSDYRSYSFWTPSAIPATVTVDCGAAASADYALIAHHNLFTQGCTIQIRASTDNFSASDVLIASSTPTDDKPVLLQFNSASYRYWRLSITAGSAPTIGACLIGEVLDIPASIASGFDPIGRTVKGQYNKTVEGHPIGRLIEFEEWAQSLTFQLITWAWLRDTFDNAWDAHLKSEPFYFAWNPTNYPKEVHHVTIEGKFSSPHLAGALANLTLAMRGLSLAA